MSIQSSPSAPPQISTYDYIEWWRQSDDGRHAWAEGWCIWWNPENECYAIGRARGETESRWTKKDISCAEKIQRRANEGDELCQRAIAKVMELNLIR